MSASSDTAASAAQHTIPDPPPATVSSGRQSAPPSDHIDTASSQTFLSTTMPGSLNSSPPPNNGSVDDSHDTTIVIQVSSPIDESNIQHEYASSSDYGSPPPLEPITPPGSIQLLVRKRDGRLQIFNGVKMEGTLRKLSYGLRVEPVVLQDIVNRVARGLKPDTPTADLQDLLSLNTNSFSFVHPDYATLAGRVFVDRLHRSTMKTFSEWVNTYGTGERPLLRPDFVSAVMQHATEIDQVIIHSRDTEYYLYSLQILYKFYLLRARGRVIERPQFLYMRIAVALHGSDLKRVLETYELLSSRAYSPATPVLYNAGTLHQNFASCFLYQPRPGPAVASLATTVRDLSSMWAADGGVGVGLGTVPAQTTSIDGHSSGPVPVLTVLDAYAGFVSANRWRRSSSVTAYLPVWHADVLSFTYSSTHRTTASSGLKHVFPALWVPDVFVERLENGSRWSLFNPDDVPLLFEVFGRDFTDAYNGYERSGLAVQEIGIEILWAAIVDSQRETGSPFILFQDNINARNNEAHLGTIRSSNLCTEIVQFSSYDYPAVCTLASLSLPHFVKPGIGFDYDELHRVTKIVVFNTDRCIDISDYPTPALQLAAERTRGLGLGVQGFADAMMMLRMPFASAEGRCFNILVFETICHAALEASCDLAEDHGPYPAWVGSPASRGILQLDMWGHVPSARYDFDSLRIRIRRVGLRNSVLTALMPTATTSKLLGNFESFEPYTSTAVVLRTGSGDFPLICPHLVRELDSRGLWTEANRRELLRSCGSLRGCSGIPDDIKAIYQTVWDIDPIDILDMAADRSPFIDQSQSLTLAVRNPTPSIMKSLMLHAWRRGLKTGMYYLRTLHPAFTELDDPNWVPPQPQQCAECCA